MEERDNFKAIKCQLSAPSIRRPVSEWIKHIKVNGKGDFRYLSYPGAAEPQGDFHCLKTVVTLPKSFHHVDYSKDNGYEPIIKDQIHPDHVGTHIYFLNMWDKLPPFVRMDFSPVEDSDLRNQSDFFFCFKREGPIGPRECSKDCRLTLTNGSNDGDRRLSAFAIPGNGNEKDTFYLPAIGKYELTKTHSMAFFKTTNKEEVAEWLKIASGDQDSEKKIGDVGIAVDFPENIQAEPIDSTVIEIFTSTVDIIPRTICIQVMMS